jgi:5-methyltetrahydrofolate corrinoid/iron sulfur protein methyltransferase
MILIGENLNIMSKIYGPAMKERDPKPVQELAEREAAAGVDYIDVNLGPARKQGDEMMAWVVKTVQEVAQKPLSLDTSNIEAIEAGLKAHKSDWGKPIINSISARPERMDALLPIAKKYDAAIVALCLGVDGVPRDCSERGALAAELLYRAAEAGIANPDIYIDPIVLPVNTQQLQVQGCTEFTAMMNDMAPGCMSMCGLSNVSNGSPAELRPILNQTYLMILRKAGMQGAIVDAFDEELKAIARGKKPELEALVSRIYDGEAVDLGSLSPEELCIAKTTKVLLGHSLYSDSWLEL